MKLPAVVTHYHPCTQKGHKEGALPELRAGSCGIGESEQHHNHSE